MAILAVARDLADLRAAARARSPSAAPSRASRSRPRSCSAAGAMTVLLKEALKPNLVQTLEGQPAFVHCGPFANIAHGNNSLVADRVGAEARRLPRDRGRASAPTWAWRSSSTSSAGSGASRPSAVVLVATVRALKHHGGRRRRRHRPRSRRAPPTSRATSGSCADFGLNAVVAVNRFPADTDEELELVRRLALEHGAHAAELNEAFEQGGEGAAALAEAVVDAADAADRLRLRLSRSTRRSRTRSRRSRQASTAPTAIFLLHGRREDSHAASTEQGLGGLPICMAKTHLSLSHDPALLERADRLHGPGARHPRVHRRRLARRALRRHADDARALGDARRVRRRHRGGRAHGRAVLRNPARAAGVGDD